MRQWGWCVVVTATLAASLGHAQSGNRQAIQSEVDAKLNNLRKFEIETVKGVVGGGLIALNTREEIQTAKRYWEAKERASSLRAQLQGVVTPQERAALAHKAERAAADLALEAEAFEKVLIKHFGGKFYYSSMEGNVYSDKADELRRRGNKLRRDIHHVNNVKVMGVNEQNVVMADAATADREAQAILKANLDKFNALSPKAKIIKVVSLGTGALMVFDALGHAYVWAQSKDVRPVGQAAGEASPQH